TISIEYSFTNSNILLKCSFQSLFSHFRKVISLPIIKHIPVVPVPEGSMANILIIFLIIFLKIFFYACMCVISAGFSADRRGRNRSNSKLKVEPPRGRPPLLSSYLIDLVFPVWVGYSRPLFILRLRLGSCLCWLGSDWLEVANIFSIKRISILKKQILI